MSFRCGVCNKPVSAGLPAHRIILESRMYEHPERKRVFPRQVIKDGRKKIEYIDDPGGVGTQIVREVMSCVECAAKHEKRQRESAGILEPEKVQVNMPRLKQDIIDAEAMPSVRKHLPSLRRFNKD